MTEGGSEVLLERNEAILVLVRGDEEGRDVLLAEAFEVLADLGGINKVILVKVESDEVVLMLLNLIVIRLWAFSLSASLSSIVMKMD